MVMRAKESAGIGILNLQGGVAEHFDHLARLNIPAKLVKERGHLDGLAGLIIPGGESTCLGKLLRIVNLTEAIKERNRAGMNIWGTCAGAILIAARVIGQEPILGLMDITIERNGFGSQLASFHKWAFVPAVAGEPIPLTFIRAPKILAAGGDVEILLEQDGYIAAAESPAALATVFHPELTPSLAFHRYFVRKCGLGLKDASDTAGPAPGWETTSWTSHSRLV